MDVDNGSNEPIGLAITYEYTSLMFYYQITSLPSNDRVGNISFILDGAIKSNMSDITVYYI
jgi:hypothetical protein